MSARQIIPQTHDPCALCHKPAATKRCGRCRAVVYCSRECQATHWKRAHKLTCGASPPPVPPRPQTPGELAEDCARQLAERGYAALGPLVDRDRRNALRTHARHEVERLLKLPLAAANARFAKIRSPEHRHAVALDLTPAVRDVVGELAVAYDACRAAFAGDEPEIVELRCLVSDAGAAAQAWHADADATRPNTRQLVLLMNLDERAVAATELLPGTHAPTFHAHVRDAFGGRLPDPPGMPALRAFDTAGAAVLYDSALFHRAPANDVGPRHVFYLGLVGQSAHAAQGATRGATNALLPELAGTLLRDLIVGVRYLGAASGSRHVGFADRVAKMRGA